MSKLNKPVSVILMTILLDAMGVGIMIPVLPELMSSVLPNATLADATLWGGILATIFALMQFLFSPTLGVASDQFGRKPVLMIALSVMIAYYLIMAVAQSLWLLIIGRIIGGVTAATHATASAYIADISKPEEKAARLVYWVQPLEWVLSLDQSSAVCWGNGGHARPFTPPPSLP